MSTAQDLPAAHSAPTHPPLALVPDPADTSPDFLDSPATPPVAWDEGEFESVLRKATPRLVRFAQRRLGNLHEAEEVSQEALLRTYQHRHTLATEDDVMAWATFASNRLVIDRLRVRGRSISVADVPEGRRVARDTAEIAEARAEARLALDALDALPARQAAVLWAREVEGSSYEEISTRFGLTEPTVRSLLHRARKALRREYSSRGGTLPFAGIAILGPWLNPLHNLRRLRLTAAGMIGTTALGVFGIGVFSLGTPLHHNLNALPDSHPIANSVSQHTIRDADIAKARPVAPAIRPTITSTQVTPNPLYYYVPSHCDTRARGVNCSPPPPNSVWIHNPMGGRIYVGTTDDGCAALNSIPASSDAHTNGYVGCDSRRGKTQSKSATGGSQ